MVVLDYYSEGGKLLFELNLPNDPEYQITNVPFCTDKTNSLNMIKFKNSVFCKHQHQIFILDLNAGAIRPQKETRNSSHLSEFVIFDCDAKIQGKYPKYRHKDKRILQNPKLFALYQQNSSGSLVEHNINSDGRDIRKVSDGIIHLQPSLDQGRFVTLAVSGLYFAVCEWNPQLEVSLRIIHRATRESLDTYIHVGSLLLPQRTTRSGEWSSSIASGLLFSWPLLGSHTSASSRSSPTDSMWYTTKRR